jgi:hypothetical protein
MNSTHKIAAAVIGSFVLGVGAANILKSMSKIKTAIPTIFCRRREPTSRNPAANISRVALTRRSV